MPSIRAEYIWIDGQRPTAKMRSKTKIIEDPVGTLANIPDWNFDGSSTEQATGGDSDRALKPVCFVPDPIRGQGNLLVLCEVMMPQSGGPHESNTRVYLRATAAECRSEQPWFGIEQEYTLYDADGIRPLRWPAGAAYPAPQGRYYCGVGNNEVYGRDLVEAHTLACMEAGLLIFGTNAEVMPSQWEFQIGTGDPLTVADHLWLARWLLYRLGEEKGITIKLDPKPMVGDWNGAGAHTNFSTGAMRAEGGIQAIKQACGRLGKLHDRHILPHVYGEDNDKRLTGKHETCSIRDFRWGVGDRGASVRISAGVAAAGKGYLEDRRPAANMDPYRVLTAILGTVCGGGFDPKVFEYFAR